MALTINAPGSVLTSFHFFRVAPASCSGADGRGSNFPASSRSSVDSGVAKEPRANKPFIASDGEKGRNQKKGWGNKEDRRRRRRKKDAAKEQEREGGKRKGEKIKKREDMRNEREEGKRERRGKNK